MATTLSYGFVKPATGDNGTVFWPALEDDIQKLNDHTHNGVNSARLTTVGSIATTQTVTSAGWVLLGDGLYRQTVTMPAALTSVGSTYDDHDIEIRDSTSGRKLVIPTQKLASTTFYVYTNDNTQGLKIIYT